MHLASAAGGAAFGHFEREQDSTADFERVFDCLQAGRQRFPFVVAEIGVGCACCDDQVVVGKFAISKLYHTTIEIDVVHLSECNLDVAMAAKDPADGSGNFSGRESGGCDLIEKRLKSVVVSAINQGDLDRMAGKLQGCVEAAESGADNYNLWCGLAVLSIHRSTFAELARLDAEKTCISL